MHYTYILYSHSLDKYYIGSTSCLKSRLTKHMRNHSGYTGKAKDWKIVFAQVFHEKKNSIAKERTIKNWKKREIIENLIKSEHNDFIIYHS